MIKVNKLDLYWYAKDKDNPELRAKRYKKVIRIRNQRIDHMKLLVGRELEKRAETMHSYYVVAEVTKADKTLGYRTIIPMVVL